MRRSLIKLVLAIIILAIALAFPKKTLAKRYTGFESYYGYDGISALISAPQNPLNLIQSRNSGESNWVSTFYWDEYGKDWLQAGWLFFWWDSTPWQYYEICVDCIGEYGYYYIDYDYAHHNWGTANNYQVYKSPTGNQWCADTGGYQRYCYWVLHENPVQVIAESEIHDYDRNDLDTWFDLVKYKDPSDENWYLFNSYDVHWVDSRKYNFYR
jgi:hypothetical protein